MTNFVITPLSFLSGTFYSVQALPESLRWLAHVNPFFYMIDGIRYGFTGHADGSIGVGVATLAIVNLALWVWALPLDAQRLSPEGMRAVVDSLPHLRHTARFPRQRTGWMDNKAVPALLPVYKRYDLAFERGEGAWLYTVDGRRILDFASGVAVTALGHAHPHLVAAVREQAGKLWHVSNLFHIPELERLADRLVAHSFADTVFVCNSGAEAMEACIKMARRYHWARGNPERHRIVTFEGAFHGRTMADGLGGRRQEADRGLRSLCCRASTSCGSAIMTRYTPRSGQRPRRS